MAMQKLTWDEIVTAASELDVEPSALWAVSQVESRSSGFLKDDRPRILFEGHVFWRELKKRDINPETHVPGNEDILYPKWTSAFYQSGTGEYWRLERAGAIHKEAALCSASWGAFQIMGFNYAACGYQSVDEFVRSMAASSLEQLRATCGFIRSQKMDNLLRNKDWAGFAKKYNGPGYRENLYDEKLRKAYEESLAQHG